MAPTVTIFPGQGSQKRGMAQDFYEESDIARRTIDEASEALELDMSSLCFEDDPRLHLTAFTQPAILAVEIAMFRSLVREYGLKPDFFAGHSLGEYTALVAAGVIPFVEALRLVRLRGRLMQDAVPEGRGAMAALIRDNLEPEEIHPFLVELEVDLANMNSPNQLVISGRAEQVDAVLGQLETHAVGQRMRMRKLQVSAPFHSHLMAGIEPEFQRALEASLPTWTLVAANRVLSNTTGTFHDTNANHLIDRLTRQISGAVRWTDNMHRIVEQEPEQIYEIGPGRPLRGFFRGIDCAVVSITNRVSARRAFET